eukprot:TRINITY_DN106208_c0_g1_i1.p1 TRINITY_DN106208_c0_g1~~TRINITY_DN106208_c0_g1_i1.p1  ORF type:complete len:146 (-),score=23.93 TRINITY_DN106208_c0_g1_i1:518-955(-)
MAAGETTGSGGSRRRTSLQDAVEDEEAETDGLLSAGRVGKPTGESSELLEIARMVSRASGSNDVDRAELLKMARNLSKVAASKPSGSAFEEIPAGLRCQPVSGVLCAVAICVAITILWLGRAWLGQESPGPEGNQNESSLAAPSP